jgi:hypothetical protein
MRFGASIWKTRRVAMTQNLLPPISTHSNASAHDLVPEILKGIVDILLACGISRDEIYSELMGVLDGSQQTPSDDGSRQLGSMQRVCMELICVWRRDPKYLAADGRPAVLPYDGQEPSFRGLCEQVSAGSDPDHLLLILTEFGAVRRQGDGRICADTPTFLLCGSKERRAVAVDGVLKQLAGFVRAIEFNTRQATIGGRTRFERSCTVTVAAELLPVFERAVRDRGQLFVDVLDEWLERHRGTKSASGTYVEIGAGAYFVDLGRINN